METILKLDSQAGSHAQTIMKELTKQQNGLFVMLMGEVPNNPVFHKKARSKSTEELVDMMLARILKNLDATAQHKLKGLATDLTEAVRKAESRYADALKALEDDNFEACQKFVEKALKHYRCIVRNLHMLVTPAV